MDEKEIETLKISIETIMKNLEMLKFVPDRLKTKHICQNAVKKLTYVIMYVLDRCKTQETHDKVFLENGGMLRFILDWYKNQKKKKIDEAFDTCPFLSEILLQLDLRL